MKREPPPKFMESFFIHGKDVSPRWDYRHHLMPPETASVTYRLESVERGAKGFLQYASLDELPEDPIYIYERLDDPTTGMLEDRLATAEKGEAAVTFSTGMAAIAATVCTFAKRGDHIISHESVYGCTYSLYKNWIPRHGIDVEFVHMVKDKNWFDKIKDNTRIIFFETPVNPTMETIDIGAIRKIADEINKNRTEENKIFVVVDNTFASPYCQRPLELGADIVIASITKHIGGFNTGMGGVVIMPQKYCNQFMMCRKDYGSVLHSKTAWNFLIYGLPTLPCRMRQQSETAMKFAHYLEHHKDVKAVYYPGLESYAQRELAEKQMRSYNGSFAPGCLLYFVLAGPAEEAREKATKVINWLATNSICYTLAVSLGCFKTLVEHPSCMSHVAIPLKDQIEAGIEPGGIRVSVGLEEADMLIEDMERAFASV